jgi:hypothetical protein
MSVTALTVFVTARTLLNDDAATLFSDTVLFPKFTEAHRELQAMLRAADCQVMRTTFAGGVNAAATVFVSPPTDLLEPIHLWEVPQGSPLTSLADMTEQDPLDPTNAAGTTALSYWQWKDEVVTFNPCAGNVTVVMLYWRQLAIPVLNTDLIGILFGELYLAGRTAALMAGSLGDEETYNVCTDIAMKSMAQIIAANKGARTVVGRP